MSDTRISELYFVCSLSEGLRNGPVFSRWVELGLHRYVVRAKEKLQWNLVNSICMPRD